MITYSTSPGSRPTRSRPARIVSAPSSVALCGASPPPRRPNGVRTAETITERLMSPAYRRDLVPDLTPAPSRGDTGTLAADARPRRRQLRLLHLQPRPPAR